MHVPASEFQSCLLSKQKINFIVLILILCISFLPVGKPNSHTVVILVITIMISMYKILTSENTNVWPRSMQYSGKLTKTSGKLLGNFWETSGKLLGNSGKLGETRGNSGRLGETRGKLRL